MPTLAEFCDTYLAHARRTIRSASDSEQRLRLHVLPVLGTRRLDEVRKGEIQRLHSELVDRMAPASANRVLATLKALLSYAVDMEVIERSPAQGVRAHKENNARQRSLAGEELQRYLLAVAEEPNPHLRGFLLLLLATGMRRGEALTAKWEHVDITNRTLLLPQTKAGKSRTILLNDQALSIVLGLPRVAANPYLFPGHKPGTHLREPKFCHERACQRAGIGNLRIHDLRHSFASLAVSNGATLYTVQALLGHSSPTMSQRYAHLSSEVLRQGSQQVSNAIAAASPAAQNPTPTT
jgi:integrase